MAAQHPAQPQVGGSRLARVLVPALMFQAVAIGGAYATGREIIEFGASYGALGWAAGLAMALIGSLMAYLVYETARRYQLFDYRAMTRHLTGRAYWLFDAVYIPFAVLVVAVLSSATGNILRDTLGLPYWLGVGAIIVVAAVVTLQGTVIIERFNGIGTVLLMLGYLVFSLLVITARWDHVVEVFGQSQHSLKPDATVTDALLIGAIYAGLGCVVYPATLITVRHLRTRSEAVWAGALTGGLYVVPWFLTYVALMGFYPSDGVFEAPVPWLTMLDGQGRLLIVVYGILVGWTLVATAVGLIQSIVVRIDQHLVDLGRAQLPQRSRAALTLTVLLLGAALAQFGIKDLISVGYLIGAIGLILVFGVPLVLRSRRHFLPIRQEPAGMDEPAGLEEPA